MGSEMCIRDSLVCGQTFILELQVVHLEADLFDIGVFVHLVLVEKNYSSAVVVTLDADVDLLALDLSSFDFGRFLVSQLPQLLQRILLNYIKLDFSRVRIKTITFLVDF